MPVLCKEGNSSFSAELIYVNAKTKLCSHATVGAPREDGIPRNVRLSFSSPDSLQGLILTRKDGVISYEYRDLCVEYSDTELLRCVDLMLLEDPSYEIRLAPNTKNPEEIRCSEEVLQIKNFKTALPDP